MKLVNLTGRNIRIDTSSHKSVMIEPCGVIAKMKQQSLDVMVMGTDLVHITRCDNSTDIINLPEPLNDTIYIVDEIVAINAWNRGRLDIGFVSNGTNAFSVLVLK